ncbi:sensor histidine kinase [Paenibacillus xerothermodurans]|uniref:histidine kinase n=1 Tax=Paenibacillus xerothermodurans TaxID=1977292 RepID=A0A2W1NMP0_PAEXE|nr:HAMP domain-containing sensor histidine kinase [Paenibacillus xerothermodurans]PZE20233.1 sensor histidine kinase [Paenibacillus xerothermodurans]
MRLRLKITLLIASSLLLVLLLFNTITYYTVVRITTNSQMELLWNGAKPLLSQAAIYDPDRWQNTEWLRPFLMPQGMVRIIDPRSVVRAQLAATEPLMQLPAEHSSRSFSHTMRTNEALIVYIQTPIIDANGRTLGSLQLARQLEALGGYLSVLVSVLTFTTAGAVLFALVSGLYFARVILRPIDRLAFIMESNQRHGIFKQMEVEPGARQDEIGQLIHTFNSMIEQLEHNFNRQKQFLADASHELKTPLTIIESYADLLKRWGGSDPSLRAEAIDAIQSEAVRLRNLTQSLLSVADTETEAHRQWERFDLSQLIETTAAKLQQAFQREVRYETEFKARAPMMNGNPGQIKQLLIILLDNAIKYSREAVHVTLHRDPHDAQNVLLVVADRGIGIEAGEIPRLFDRFYRVDQARSRATGGSGLGLSIAQNIVWLHKGTISIGSTPGVGTKVIVTLPLNAARN